jgi:hypothetical protein
MLRTGDHAGRGGVPVSKAAGSEPDPRNPVGDVTNVLGFLLAGFGAVLSFLGLRSGEVTTVLRNDASQASLIALLLLLGVLAAVVTVTTKDTGTRAASPLLASGLLVTLFGLGILVIYLIPVGASRGSTASLVSGLLVIAAGLVVSAMSRSARRAGRGGQPAAADGGSEATEAAGGTEPAEAASAPTWPTAARPAPEQSAVPDGHQKAGGSARARMLEPRVPVTLLLILSSVILIAMSAYGGMRLETKSQLSFSSQVGATFSVAGRLATVRVDITAARIPQNDWVFVDAYALRAGVDLGRTCALLHKDFPEIPRNDAPCITDPCLYFSREQYEGIARCAVLSNGSIVPDATGNVDETLSFPFVAADYQDVDVRAEVCSITHDFCEGSSIGQNSRLDWAVPRAGAG